MSTYARMVERAIADLDDPMERLAGALITVARLPELSGAGVNSGLARLRLKRSEERRVGKECVSTGRYRWSTYNEKKKTTTNKHEIYQRTTIGSSTETNK